MLHLLRSTSRSTFVSLNIMWTHLEQRSFNMSETGYMEKLDAVAYMLNTLGQTAKVRNPLQ